MWRHQNRTNSIERNASAHKGHTVYGRIIQTTYYTWQTNWCPPTVGTANQIVLIKFHVWHYYNVHTIINNMFVLEIRQCQSSPTNGFRKLKTVLELFRQGTLFFKFWSHFWLSLYCKYKLVPTLDNEQTFFVVTLLFLLYTQVYDKHFEL